MGYDLYWVQDPYADEREARTERFFEEARVDLLSRSDPSRVFSGMFAVQEEDGAYFRASMGVMAAIRHELEYQGFADFAAHFICNEGIVPPDAIAPVLARVQMSPTMPADVSNPLDALFDAMLPDATVTSGGEALLDAPPGTWQAKWARFIEFLRGALTHGGIEVT